MKCVVLSGATVPFSSLIKQLTPELVEQLKKLGYNDIQVQYGHAKADFIPSPNVKGFDFDPRIKERISDADLVITHAGAGSLLDSLERGHTLSHRKIIVVINSDLMNNHQTELAYKLENLGCAMVVQQPSGLSDAIFASSKRNFNQLEPPTSIAPIVNALMS